MNSKLHKFMTKPGLRTQIFQLFFKFSISPEYPSPVFVLFSFWKPLHISEKNTNIFCLWFTYLNVYRLKLSAMFILFSILIYTYSSVDSEVLKT